MNAKEKKRKYLNNQGFFIRKPQPSEFKKTENGYTYAYGVEIAREFTKWSAHQRTIGKPFDFALFYDGSDHVDKMKVQITINKNHDKK